MINADNYINYIEKGRKEDTAFDKKYRNRERKRLLNTFLALLPQGRFWKWEKTSNFMLLSLALLESFLDFFVKAKGLTDGYFLKNNKLIDQYAKLFNEEIFTGLDDFRDRLKGGMHFSVKRLKDVVASADTSTDTSEDKKDKVKQGQRGATCVSECTGSLDPFYSPFVFFINNMSIDGVSKDKFIKKLKREKPAFCLIFVDKENVDD